MKQQLGEKKISKIRKDYNFRFILISNINELLFSYDILKTMITKYKLIDQE